MANLRARRATAHDVDELRRLHAEATAPHASLWSGRGGGLGPAAWVAAHTPAVLVGDGTIDVGFAVAISDGIPLGAPRCAEAFVYNARTNRRHGGARA